jgi:eukaryotic-like serine/threonine-protein kinase
MCSPWVQLSYTAMNTRSAASVVGVWTHWQPWDALAWLSAAESSPDAAAALSNARRAYRLASENAYAAAVLFNNLLRAGLREEARSVAMEVRRDEVPVLVLQSQILLLRIDASEAQLGRALGRALEVLKNPRGDGYALTQLLELTWSALGIASVLGREREVADLAYAGLMAPEPPHLDRDDVAPARAIPLCAAASKDVSARCFARLQSLFDAGWFRIAPVDTRTLMEGARYYASGDHAAAARVLRPRVGTRGAQEEALTPLMAEVFDKAGDLELAARLDEPALVRAGEYNGVDLAYVRMARRLAKRDPDRARALAGKVVEAWSTADDKPPSLEEMRRLLER